MKKNLFALALVLGMQLPAMAGMTEGAAAYKAGNYPLALKEIMPLAKSGQAEAQHLLGLMYYMGQGVVRDYQQALAWHRKAALQGKADAQYVLGAMYYTGNAIGKDSEAAVKWFRKAAEQGHAEAQYALGLMYRFHTAGMPDDSVLAYTLWSLAAAGGNANAVEQRAAISRRMSHEQIEEAQGMAMGWKTGTPLPTKSHTGAR